MAIIQSILVGKGKGKIGNVVLSGLKGQTVAKQLNSSPSNPRTVAQTDNRVKMANAVLAWQFLAVFFSAARALRKPLESTYNAFVRIVKEYMLSTLETSRAVAASNALSSDAFLGNWISLISYDDSAGSPVVSFNTSGLPYVMGSKIQLLYMKTSSSTQEVVEVAVSGSDWNAGAVTVPAPTITAASLAAAYMYTSDGSKISNVIISGL